MTSGPSLPLPVLRQADLAMPTALGTPGPPQGSLGSSLRHDSRPVAAASGTCNVGGIRRVPVGRRIEQLTVRIRGLPRLACSQRVRQYPGPDRAGHAAPDDKRIVHSFQDRLSRIIPGDRHTRLKISNCPLSPCLRNAGRELIGRAVAVRFRNPLKAVPLEVSLKTHSATALQASSHSMMTRSSVFVGTLRIGMS